MFEYSFVFFHAGLCRQFIKDSRTMVLSFLILFLVFVAGAIAMSISVSIFSRKIALEVLTDITIDTLMNVWADAFPFDVFRV